MALTGVKARELLDIHMYYQCCLQQISKHRLFTLYNDELIKSYLNIIHYDINEVDSLLPVSKKKVITASTSSGDIPHPFI